MNQSAAQQYQQNSILTASPGELTHMLYKGLVKFLRMSLLELDRKNLEGIHANLMKSQSIIEELLFTLNMNISVSENMASMYRYMLERLIEANLKKDRTVIEELLGFAEEFRDIWSQAMKVVK
ncbi:flagellar export chaperone FliS [Aneurinibacillus sp. Ricciae_BoGa-3]|uniref:flagellar export chaperone FliS n=1 Tax=Aneurinibacillus sp. Ricciae_BoGa-3 TaxID=3022697 RepID=UPI00233FA6EF|nr:flagellar export chaperone FliS [Aneurinibacillus sp. Ricciae_BoGa-3]WCK54184.1 flagellar export chaperone FliS [Aneurinibacillus sp. Ricciae_BoGa-3]